MQLSTQVNKYSTSTCKVSVKALNFIRYAYQVLLTRYIESSLAHSKSTQWYYAFALSLK
jgi:hypothetical protein